jgi:hypothetical protein
MRTHHHWWVPAYPLARQPGFGVRFGRGVAAAAASVLLVAGATACGGGGNQAATTTRRGPTLAPRPTNASPTSAPRRTTEPTDTIEPPTETPTEPPTAGAFWDGLFGKSLEDPVVTRLATSCGSGSQGNSEIGNSPDLRASGDIYCKADGFNVNLDSELRVRSVTLYNEENGGFSQYQGDLPYGLTWDMSYNDVINELGAPDERRGGNGLEVELVYNNLGSDKITVTTTATHDNPDYLADAGLHMIDVSRL